MTQTMMRTLKNKILKIARGLGKFTVENLCSIFEGTEKEYNILIAVDQLLDNDEIKKVSETEYISIVRPVVKPEEKKVIEKYNETKDSKEDTWLTVDEVAIITNVRKETIIARCLSGKYEIKANPASRRTNPESTYLIKRSSVQLVPRLTSKEIAFLNKEVKKLFNNQEEERLYKIASDRGKEYIYRFLKLLTLTKGMDTKELKEFLTVISFKNPRLAYSYSQFSAKRNEYYKKGLAAVIPKHSAKDHRTPEEMNRNTNYNRFPVCYTNTSKDQLDIIFRCICLSIPITDCVHLTGRCKTAVSDIYKFIKGFIYEEQYKELEEHFQKDPIIASVRNFAKETIYLYCYDNRIFVAKKPLTSITPMRKMTKEEFKEVKRVYSLIYRRVNIWTMTRYLEYHVATLCWQIRLCCFEQQMNDLYKMLNPDFNGV